MTSFASLSARHRLKDNSKLLTLDKLINWNRFSGLLSGLHKNDIDSNGGRRSYDKIAMLKLVLLGQWNSLPKDNIVRINKLRFIKSKSNINIFYQ